MFSARGVGAVWGGEVLGSLIAGVIWVMGEGRTPHIVTDEVTAGPRGVGEVVRDLGGMRSGVMDMLEEEDYN